MLFLAMKSLLRINVVKTEALLKLLHVIKNLSYDSHLRNLLIDNGYIEVLTALLEEQRAEKLEMIHNQALNSLFYLLQLNPLSQERAAVAGAIPPLMHLVKVSLIIIYIFIYVCNVLFLNDIGSESNTQI